MEKINKRKAIFLIFFFGLIVLVTYLGYFFSNGVYVCRELNNPVESRGGVVLTTEEAIELYDVDNPIYVPQNKIENRTCRRGIHNYFFWEAE